MNAEEMFEALGYSLKMYNKYTIKYSKEECNYTTLDFNLDTKRIYSRFMSKAHGITLDELKAVIQQAKELGWLDEEKQEIKQETNFEHYKDEILDNCFDSLAVVKGIPKLCYKTSCNNCDFKLIQKECHEKVMDWLKQPYKKMTYKLNKFEFDLIQTYSDCHESCKFSEFKQFIELKDKGYFKDIDLDLKIHEILDNCEVVG